MTNVTDKITETTQCCAQTVTGALDKARSALADAREALVHAVPIEKARAGARALDDYAHDAPWSVVAGAVAVGLAVGFLLRRR